MDQEMQWNSLLSQRMIFVKYQTWLPSIIILCIGLFLHTSPLIAQDKLLAKQFTIVLQNSSVEEALFELSNKTNINIAFSNNIIPAGKVKSRIFSNSRLDTILNYVIDTLPIKYIVEGKQIILVRAEHTEYFKFSGHVIDSITGERLPSVNIIQDGAGKYFKTNESGYFYISLEDKQATFQFHFIGYKSKLIQWDQRKKGIQTIELKPDHILDPVTIEENTGAIQSSPKESYIRIGKTDLWQSPGMAGEQDLFPALTKISGITSGPEGVGGIQIRGSSPDQNLFLIDGVPIFYPSHALGMVSILQGASIKSIDVYKNDIPARFVGRTGGAIDIRINDGNLDKMTIGGEVNPISAKCHLEGPMGNIGSFYLGLRRTVMDPWILALSKFINQQSLREGKSNFYFYDGIAKLNFLINNKSKLNITYYKGADNYSSNFSKVSLFSNATIKELNDENLQWDNLMTSVRFSHELTPKWFSISHITYSNFNSTFTKFNGLDILINNDNIKTYYFNQIHSGVKEFSFKTELQYTNGNNIHIRLGLSTGSQTYTPSLLSLNGVSDVDLRNQKNNLYDLFSKITYAERNNFYHSQYGEFNYQLKRNVHISLGLAGYEYLTETKPYYSLEPRGNIKVDLSNRIHWYASYYSMNQHTHLLNNNSIGRPTDLWIPTTEKLFPEKTNQFSSGIQFQLLDQWNLNVEVYQKKMQNIFSYKKQKSFIYNGTISAGGILPSYWDELLDQGSGKMYGIELNSQVNLNKQKWNCNLVYARSMHDFPDDDKEGFTPAPNDMPVQVHIQYIAELRKHLHIQLQGSYHSGRPLQLAKAIYYYYAPLSPNQTIYYVDTEQFLRSPYYLRLDAMVHLNIPGNRWNQLLSLGLMNVLNRKNTLYVKVENSTIDPSKLSYSNVFVSGIIPMINYKFQF